ncbi:MAG: aminotransferase class V-fold PLP-dependent enzyme [Gemmatimonadaceae bacterium]
MRHPVDDERLAAWRQETPGTTERVHLNNAGAALMPRVVIDAIQSHTELEGRIGGYEAADARVPEIEQVYTDLAQLVGAAPRNIALTGSATASFIQAISTVDFAPDDVILTSRADYTSYQIQYLALSKRLGVRVIHAADLPEGGIDPDDVRKILSVTRPRFVSVSWMPTHGGLIQDVHAVSDVCEEFGASLHVDACQAVGQLPIDVTRLRCDYLSATARKFLRGPRGIGFLYASERALDRGDYPLLVDMRGAEWVSPTEFRVASSARRFEDWEFAYSLVLGLGAAARYALAAGVEATGARAIGLASYLREQLRTIEGVRVLDTGRMQSAIVTFDHDRLAPADIVGALESENINAVVSQRWYGLLDFSTRGVEGAVRASPHYYNTVGEIDQLVDVVRRSSSSAR